LTLTAAATIILSDRPWTPGDAAQAEDRVRRIGQTKEVRSIWVTAFEVDEQIDKILEQKDQTAKAVVDSRHRDVGNETASAPKLSIHQLLKQLRDQNKNTLKGSSAKNPHR